MTDDIIKERCAEESDSFIDSIVVLMQNLQAGKDFEISKDIASKRARDISKCMLKKREY